MISKGNVKLIVDQNGRATLSGQAGPLTFSGKPALDQLGVSIKRIRVNFNNKSSMKIGYSATVSLEIISMTVKGSFDLEELITSCSGFLCKAAKALTSRKASVDRELKNIMGR